MHLLNLKFSYSMNVLQFYSISMLYTMHETAKLKKKSHHNQSATKHGNKSRGYLSLPLLLGIMKYVKQPSLSSSIRFLDQIIIRSLIDNKTVHDLELNRRQLSTHNMSNQRSIIQDLEFNITVVQNKKKNFNQSKTQ